MRCSAHDVARELRQRLPGCDPASLQKLLYYCQGWHITFTGEPLFEERIEAWAYGPVVASLWADEKYDRPRPRPRELDENGLAIVDLVVRKYGMYSGKELIRRTHDEAPWRDVSESDDPLSPPNPEITHVSLRQCYERE